jgi:hypothetical protein
MALFNQTVKGGEIWMAPVLPGVSAEVTIAGARAGD